MPPSAGRPVDFNEDDFEEYNPHPYLGGYDIALTYGDPLPPSSATCYPISSSASPPSEQTTPPPPHATTPTFDHGLPEKYQPEPFPSPDLFRSWPYSTWEDRQIYHGDAEAGGGWNGWRRALDYLFGHAQGYGEMRVGVDSDGIPIYANKKLGGAESVVVEVEPAPVQRLECYHPDSVSWKYEPSPNNSRSLCIFGSHPNSDIVVRTELIDYEPLIWKSCIFLDSNVGNLELS